MSFNWRDIVSSVAPVLGTALGGPFGALAGKAIGMAVANKKDASEEDLAELILSGDPAVLMDLKRAEQDFKVQMKELGIKEEDLVMKDKASARDMAAKTSIIPQVALSIVFVIGYFGVVFGLAYVTFTGVANEQLNAALLSSLTTVLGVLTAAIPQILSFWFGSSRSSQSKDEKLQGK